MNSVKFEDSIDTLYAQSDRLYMPQDNKTYPYYFVAAHTVNGGRFYSETFQASIDAMPIYQDYADIIVKYFGGGQVEMFRIDENDFDIISMTQI